MVCMTQKVKIIYIILQIYNEGKKLVGAYRTIKNKVLIQSVKIVFDTCLISCFYMFNLLFIFANGSFYFKLFVFLDKDLCHKNFKIFFKLLNMYFFRKKPKRNLKKIKPNPNPQHQNLKHQLQLHLSQRILWMLFQLGNYIIKMCLLNM